MRLDQDKVAPRGRDSSNPRYKQSPPSLAGMCQAPWMIVRFAALGLSLALCATSCSDTKTTTESPAITTDPVDYSQPGQYNVGVLNLQVDADHRLSVFYPADTVPSDAKQFSYSGTDLLAGDIAKLLPGAFRNPITVDRAFADIPASTKGPFPLVVFSHGFGSSYRFSSRHHAHVASYGFVVVTVDHPERGLASQLGQGPADKSRSDVQELTDGVAAAVAESKRPGSLISGAIEPERLAAEGHSAGGRASANFTMADARVDAWIGLAPSPPGDRPMNNSTTVPGPNPAAANVRGSALIITADADVAIPTASSDSTFEGLKSPKRKVVLDNSGHNVFTDICAPIQTDGGLAATIRALGFDPDTLPIVKLGEDGCMTKNPPAADSLRVFNHLVTAHLLSVFGPNPEQATKSLATDWLNTTFPKMVESNQAA